MARFFCNSHVKYAYLTCNKKSIVELLLTIFCRCVEILLDYDSPVNPVDRDNTTPLHVAAKYGHHKVSNKDKSP